MRTPPFAYLVIRWWTHGWLPHCGCREPHCSEHTRANISWWLCFQFFGIYTQNRDTVFISELRPDLIGISSLPSWLFPFRSHWTLSFGREGLSLIHAGSIGRVNYLANSNFLPSSFLVPTLHTVSFQHQESSAFQDHSQISISKIGILDEQGRRILPKTKSERQEPSRCVGKELRKKMLHVTFGFL